MWFIYVIQALLTAYLLYCIILGLLDPPKEELPPILGSEWFGPYFALLVVYLGEFDEETPGCEQTIPASCAVCKNWMCGACE